MGRAVDYMPCAGIAYSIASSLIGHSNRATAALAGEPGKSNFLVWIKIWTRVVWVELKHGVALCRYFYTCKPLTTIII